MSIFKTFNQPFPFEPPPKGTLGTSAFFGVFVFVFLLVFKPFGLNELSFYHLLRISFTYGLITFSCVFLPTSILPFLFPSVFNEVNWTTGKHILFITGTLFLVGLANYLLSPLLVGSRLTLYNAIWFQGITIAIGVIPIGIFSLIRQNQLLKRYSAQAKILEKKLSEKQQNTNVANREKGGSGIENFNSANVANKDANETKKKANEEPDSSYTNVSNKIVLAGDYHNEKVEVYADDLYIIASASNYIKLFHLQKQKLVYSIIRSTIKKAETIVIDHPNFFKCHRAHIINLDKVIHVEGNAQGYKVRIDGHEELIPVSRNLNSEFSDKLLAFRRR